MDSRHSTLSLGFGILLAALAAGARSNPNHLVPIEPYDSLGYNQAVFTSFIGPRQPMLWMIELPSFSPEYAVILEHEIEYDANDTRPRSTQRIEHERWMLEYAEAGEPIWRWKDVGDGSAVLDIHPTENLKKWRIPVTQDFANTMQKTWESVLKLTKYPDEPWFGLDGTTLQFYTSGYFGEIWTPESGLPAALADLGHKLRDLTQADEEKRESLSVAAADLAVKITKQAGAQRPRTR